MKTYLTIALSLIVWGNAVQGQVQPTLPTIEIQGHAEKEVTPDEIYVMVHLVERYEGKTKITIDQQESELLALMKSKGLDPSSVSMSGGNASYVKIPWKAKKDVLARTNYEIMVKTAQEAAIVFEAVDELNISSCNIGRVDHSNREELEKQIRIDAMKDAAEKADYMLNAVGSKRGATLHVTENRVQPLYANQRGFLAAEYEYGSYSKTNTNFEVSFKKIELSSTVFVKFKIE